MSIDARNATAEDFEKAAQEHANASWFWLILAGVIFYFFQWWAAIPATIGVFTIIQSISSTKQATNLRNGTYRIPNSNNGVPENQSNESGSQDLVAQQAIQAAKVLGAKSAREAAEITMGRELSDPEWNEYKEPWERNWS
jgi:hypothetical protein